MRVSEICAVVALTALAGCSDRNKEQIAFDGVVFPARVAAVDKKVSLADFTTTVEGATASLDGAREAGRYQGIRYCIENYGTSQIVWTVGPDTPVDRLSIVDGALTFRGRCDP
jgi:hypothetical protein